MPGQECRAPYSPKTPPCHQYPWRSRVMAPDFERCKGEVMVESWLRRTLRKSAPFINGRPASSLDTKKVHRGSPCREYAGCRDSLGNGPSIQAIVSGVTARVEPSNQAPSTLPEFWLEPKCNLGHYKVARQHVVFVARTVSGSECKPLRPCRYLN